MLNFNESALEYGDRQYSDCRSLGRCQEQGCNLAATHTSDNRNYIAFDISRKYKPQIWSLMLPLWGHDNAAPLSPHIPSSF